MLWNLSWNKHLLTSNLAVIDAEAGNLPHEPYDIQLRGNEQAQPLMGVPTIREDERQIHHALGDVLEGVSRILRSQSG